MATPTAAADPATQAPTAATADPAPKSPLPAAGGGAPAQAPRTATITPPPPAVPPGAAVTPPPLAVPPAAAVTVDDGRLTGEDLRFILGLKLKQLRHARGLTLQRLAALCGLSVSYLSEIEKGKKYPKAAKMLDLAAALGVPFEELMSPQVDAELAPVKTVFSTEFLQSFPFELFGVDPEDLFGIATGRPERVAALIRALRDVGRTYDVQVEQVLLAALRSYQQLNHNHFPHLEDAAARCRAEHAWPSGEVPSPATLAAALEREHGYRIDLETLPAAPDLRGFRSVYLGGRPPRLLVNGNLMPSQQAFVLARELGYRYLDLTGKRAVTSSWIKVESFEQVLNNFYASYFAGALLIERDRLVADLRQVFARRTWDAGALAACIGRYGATPELFFHRLTELLPQLLGLQEIFFLRFAHDAGQVYRLNKFLNVSRVPVPHGVGPGETYCRRWPALRLMRHLEQQPRRPLAQPAITAERSSFLDAGAEFIVLTMARPLTLASDATSSVSVGILLDDACKRTIAFWDDPAIPRTVVNLSCERCPLAPADCHERAAAPTILYRLEARARKESAIAALLRTGAAPRVDPAG
jgi:XRE family transcriptional regulator, fatty acid utilization regulator